MSIRKRIVSFTGFSGEELSSMEAVSFQNLRDDEWTVVVPKLLEVEDGQRSQYGVNVVKVGLYDLQHLRFIVENFVAEHGFRFLFLFDSAQFSNPWEVSDAMEVIYAEQHCQHVPFAVLPIGSDVMNLVIERLNTYQDRLK